MGRQRPRRIRLFRTGPAGLRCSRDGTGRFAHNAINVDNNQVVQALNPSQPLGDTSLLWMSAMKLHPPRRG